MNKIAILCIDDENIILESLKIQLESTYKNKYLFEYAEDSEEAMELVDYFLSEKIQLLLVISDYQMPGMKGDELVMRLKSKLPTVKIIMLTGQMPSDIKDSLLAKNIVLKVISKPWDKAELLNIINTLA